jgi:hypothetical protein
MVSNLNDSRAFLSKTPIEFLFSKILNLSISEYIYHTKAYLEYDEEEVFVFILHGFVIFTQAFEDNETQFDTNIVIYKISYNQVLYNLN